MPFSTITALPTAPQRTDDAETFTNRADAFVAAMVDLPTEINTVTTEIAAAAALIDAAPSYADAGLVSIASLTIAADEMIYGTAADTFGKATITAFGRSLLDDTDATTARTTLGLGTMATQAASSVAITGGSIAGITDLAVADGGTGASTASAARTSLGLDPLVVPSGAVMAFAMSTAPTGWLECDGSAVSRTTYADLFTAISTTFGVGDGSTTFNLPDLRGEFIRGYDNGRGVDSGRVFGSSQADELKAHTHTETRLNNTTNSGRPGGSDGNIETVNTGSTGGAETRPRNIAMLYAIKT